jgi:acyl carrier protein
MNRKKIDKVVMNLIGEVLPYNVQSSKIETSHSLMLDLGITSIGLMSLAFRLEEELDIDLMEHSDEYAELQTIEELQTFLHQILSN